MDLQNLQLSVVVPLLNEQENIRPLYEQIKNALCNKFTYEIIFIDDGSTDQTRAKLLELYSKYRRPDSNRHEV